jgi:hypothetical protein
LDDRTRAAPPRPLYDEDFALWVEEQVAALRAGDVAALDVHNLTLELEGLTKRDERALGAQLKRIMAHILKQRHQPQRASRSWADSIANGREEIADILEQSPSLRRSLPGLMLPGSPRHAPAGRGLPERAAVLPGGSARGRRAPRSVGPAHGPVSQHRRRSFGSGELVV